jgi:acyl-CoA hydrolase
MHQLNRKPVKASQVEMTELVIPNDTNRLGNLLGGRVMRIAAHEPSVCNGICGWTALPSSGEAG